MMSQSIVLRNKLGQFKKGSIPYNKGKKIGSKPFRLCSWYGEGNPVCIFCNAYVPEDSPEWVRRSMCQVGRHLIDI